MKLIIKGILMYATLVYWLFLIAFIDSFDATYILIFSGIGFLMLSVCRVFISLEDVAVLTGNNSEELKDETV